jgi:hypothetical protein
MKSVKENAPLVTQCLVFPQVYGRKIAPAGSGMVPQAPEGAKVECIGLDTNLVYNISELPNASPKHSAKFAYQTQDASSLPSQE